MCLGVISTMVPHYLLKVGNQNHFHSYKNSLAKGRMDAPACAFMGKVMAGHVKYMKQAYGH